MNKRFNSLRYAEDFPLTPLEKIRMKTVLEFIGPRKKRILDLGCGDGYLMEIMKRHGHEVEGIEIAEGALKKARKKGFVVHDISLSEPWAHVCKKPYDIVFGGEIIEHVFDTDHLLKESSNVLKKGGKIILSTPNLGALGRRLMLLVGINPHIETTARTYDAGHVRYFMRSTLKKLLEENGFQVLSMTSSAINFNNQGTFYSEILAHLFPSWGNNIIVQAQKSSKK